MLNENSDSMKKIFYLFLMVFAIPIASTFHPTNAYCNLESCPYGSHTMCLYADHRPNRRCQRIIRLGLSDREKSMIINVHNTFRTRVFTGQELRGNPGPQFAAVQNIPVEWDEEIANISQRWVQQCIIISDICRNVNRFRVGQNYISSDFDEDMDEELELSEMQELIESWYYEVVRYNRSNVYSYCEYAARNKTTYHYTQMVWGRTTKIGCGAIRYYRDVYPVPKILFACNYGPRGNCRGEPVYEVAG